MQATHKIYSRLCVATGASPLRNGQMQGEGVGKAVGEVSATQGGHGTKLSLHGLSTK